MGETAMDILENGYGWIEYRFQDGSRQLIFTTMNPVILHSRGIQLRTGYVYNLLHEEYVPLRNDTLEILIHSDKPESKEGLQRFADRFI